MKKPMDPFAANGRQQMFVFGECDTSYVLMSSCVVVNGGQLNGGEVRGHVLVQRYKVSPENGAERDCMCVKLIGKKETVVLLLSIWHDGSPVPRAVILPCIEGQPAPKRGKGGYVFWSGRGPDQDPISRYLRRPTSANDKLLWTALHTGCKQSRDLPAELFGAFDGPEVGGQEAGVTESAAVSPADWPVVAARAFGPGFLIDDEFWITADFTRTITRPKKANEKLKIWHVPLFTGRLLKVLLDSRAPLGLSSREVYARAVVLYKQMAEQAKAEGRTLPEAPKFKPLGQFFRVTVNDNHVEHDLYEHIKKNGHKPMTYVLRGKWGAVGEDG